MNNTAENVRKLLFFNGLRAFQEVFRLYMMEAVQMKSRADNSHRQEEKVSMRDFLDTIAPSADAAKKGTNR